MFHLLLSVIYLAFISLGLPDALLGSAWPSMYPAFHVPVSYAGIISMIIAAGTVTVSYTHLFHNVLLFYSAMVQLYHLYFLWSKDIWYFIYFLFFIPFMH